MEQIRRKRLMPVVVIDDAALAVPLAETLLAAGLDVMEVTFRTAAATDAIRAISTQCPKMLIGAGTLLTPEQVDRAVDSGAKFGVAPGLNEKVVLRAHAHKIPMFPGVMTPSEIEKAIELDCRVLKFFPAEPAGGVKMLQAFWSPYSHTGISFVPLGGVNAKNMADYLALPAVCAIGGSWMVEKKLIAAKDWAQIGALTREALAIAAGVKKS
jgi:2-dehydro-3-deoxyphosphogluconate aldolase/(4S)-4-hydroxy-2-oxoglutarate aldolase